MGDKVFSYRTRGGVSPENKPKVFFTCHRDDFDRCFESIASGILEVYDCALFYTTDSNADLSDENTLIALERMSLFVIPVSYTLLSTYSRAIDSDFRFAQDKHIPVLPLLIDSDVYDLYKKPENFGELQYLTPDNTDSTAIAYKEKLGNYLNSVLVNDVLVQRIRNAFDGYIFLSYRKKDRKHANELMKLIHKNPECEDIAIWFDEFLTPGENFRTNIDKMLSDSELFALLVTPHLLERYSDGTPNFVMAEEFPAARKMGKKIFPVVMEDTNREELKRDFIDIPACTNVYDEKEFNQRLTDLLTSVARSENNNDPEHNFLIGLAYIKGIDVEIDLDRGVKLITKAAESGLPEAMEKIYRMYRDGDCVQLDYRKALHWAEKIYEDSRISDGEDSLETLNNLNRLAIVYGDVGDYQKKIDLLDLCYQHSLNNDEIPDESRLSYLCNLAIAYGDIGNYSKHFEYCQKCYLQVVELYGEEHTDYLTSLNNLANAYSKVGDYRQSLELNEKCYQKSRIILGEDHPDTLNTMSNLAKSFGDIGDYYKSFEICEECLVLKKKVLGEKHPSTLCTYNYLALAYNKIGDYKKGLEISQNCYELCKEVFGQDHPNTLRTLNGLSLMYCDIKNYPKFLELSKECYELKKNKLGEKHPDTLIALNTLARAYYDDGDLHKSVMMFEECYGLDKNVFGEQHPETLRVLSNYARAIAEMGNYEESLELCDKCYQLEVKILGEEHPDTLITLNNLAKSSKLAGNLNNCYEYYKRCFISRLKVLNEEHPDTLDSLFNLASSYYEIGEKRKSLKAYEYYYSICKGKYGFDDETCRKAMEEISRISNELGEFEF